MLNKYVQMEIDYTKFFSKCKEYEHYYEFKDSRLPGMYVHNYILFKEDIEQAIVYNTILIQLQKRKAEKANFLRVEFNTPTNLSFINRLPEKPSTCYYECMAIETSVFKSLKGHMHCVIIKADLDNIFEDGRKVDIVSNQKKMGINFATRRIQRKIEAYQENPTLDFFVCYDGGKAIGNVELAYNEHIAKIEDFDIVPEQQRKGFGTFVLKEMLHQAYNRGLSEAYLITESDDTAKEMYHKCGFKTVGQKIELIFDF